MPTQAEIEDFIRRNPGDHHRAVEALTNYTGDREFDSQGPMYDQRTNQLSPQGQQATAQLRQRRGVQPGSLSSLLAYQAPMVMAPGVADQTVQPVTNFFQDPVSTTMPVDPRLQLASLLRTR